MRLTGTKRPRDNFWIDDKGAYHYGDDSYETAIRNMNRGGRAPPQRQGNALMMKPYAPRTPGGQIIAQRKYFDSSVASSTITKITTSWGGCEENPTTLNTLFCPTHGNDISNRESRSCFVYNIKITGSIIIPPVTGPIAANTGDMCRLVLVLDKQSNGTQMNAEDLIESGTGSPMMFGYQSTKTFGRFQVLKDKTFSFPVIQTDWNGTAASQAGYAKPFKLKHTFRNPLKINFNDTNGGTVADIVDTSFNLLGAGFAATGPVLTLNYKCRVSFKG
ncbi:MAG: putative capsid protein [Cressdnaviricota sp.]|nr:MAG: putative capsid protein [Cressdnaviricota sp.]